MKRSKAPAKRVQHFIKHYTTFVAHCCMLFDHEKFRGGQTNAKFRTTRLNMSSKTKSTKECGGKITADSRVQQSTTKLHGVAKRVQHHTISRKTKEMSCRTTFVQ